MTIDNLIGRHRAGETIDSLAPEIGLWPYQLVRLFAESGYAVPTKSMHLRAMISRHFEPHPDREPPPEWVRSPK